MVFLPWPARVWRFLQGHA